MGELCHMLASEPRVPPNVTLFGDRVFPEVTEVTKAHWLGPIPVRLLFIKGGNVETDTRRGSDATER